MLVLLLPFATAQGDDDEVETQLLPLYENTTDDAAALEDAYYSVQELRRQPLDINRVGTDELTQIPGITHGEVNAIMEYRHKYGDFRSIGELALIPSIGDRQRRFLATVLCVDSVDGMRWYSRERLKRDVKHIKHTILVTATVPTYYRAGDKGATATGAAGVNKYANTYLGDPVRHSLRYSASLGSNVIFNLTGAKTAGEPFFAAGNGMGYDSYAVNLSVRDLGIFRHVILGQYRAQFGMGLVLNNNFSPGKQAVLSSMGRIANVFTPHSSASDSRHLQGAAATADFGRASVSAFFSCRGIDATLNADSTIATILTDGYHRTGREMSKKNNATQTTAGMHADYGFMTRQGLDWSVGVSFLHTSLSRAINPVFSKADTISASRLYRRFHPTGDSFWNAGIDYRVRWRGIFFAGETALCNTGGLATVNHLMWEAARRVTLMLGQRFYAYDYHSLYGSGLSEGGSIQNESAVLLGARWNATRRLTVDAYTDIAYFPWLRYRVSSSSYAWDNSVSATLTHRQWTISARYRLRMRQKDETLAAASGGTLKHLASCTAHRLRLTALLDNTRWTARSNVEGCLYSEDSHGIIASQAVGWKPNRLFRLYAHAAYFNTSDYDSRLYAYERGMLNTFGNASYYGNGMRLALLLRADFTPGIMFQTKVGHTRYFDRDYIGTAERRIFSSHQTDIDLQIRLKL